MYVYVYVFVGSDYTYVDVSVWVCECVCVLKWEKPGSGNKLRCDTETTVRSTIQSES
jgi:hypothetical protein